MEINETLQKRGKTHGKFEDNAWLAQKFKELFRGSSNWHDLSSVQRESLDLLALKLSRILSGDPNYSDNWHDAQGYLKLAEESLKNE